MIPGFPSARHGFCDVELTCLSQNIIMGSYLNMIIFVVYNPTISNQNQLAIRKTKNEETDFVTFNYFPSAHTFIFNALEQPLEQLFPWLWNQKCYANSVQDCQFCQ